MLTLYTNLFTMIDRIKLLMGEKKMSATQFSDEIEIQRSSLSHVLSGRNKPSLDFMLKIKNRFSEISLDWLLLGSGNMYQNKNEEEFQPDDLSKTEIISKPQIGSKESGGTKRIDPNSVFEVKRDKEEIETELKSTFKGDKKIKQLILLYGNDTFRTFKPEE